jgi:hypothetical protein
VLATVSPATPAFTSAVLASNALTMDARRRGGRTPRTSDEMAGTNTPCLEIFPGAAGVLLVVNRAPADVRYSGMQAGQDQSTER